MALTENPLSWLWHLILPWTVLAVVFIGFYSRVLRGNVLDTLGEEYVLAARAKGLSERRILVRHVLRNSLIPIVTLWGLDLGAVIGGGAVLTETVFDIQGGWVSTSRTRSGSWTFRWCSRSRCSVHSSSCFLTR